MKALLLSLALAQGADLATTCHRLDQGYLEGNPLLPGTCAGITVVKSAAVAVAFTQWGEKTPPMWLKVAVAAGIVAGTWGAVHNLRKGGP